MADPIAALRDILATNWSKPPEPTIEDIADLDKGDAKRVRMLDTDVIRIFETAHNEAQPELLYDYVNEHVNITVDCRTVDSRERLSEIRDEVRRIIYAFRKGDGSNFDRIIYKTRTDLSDRSKKLFRYTIQCEVVTFSSLATSADPVINPATGDVSGGNTFQTYDGDLTTLAQMTPSDSVFIVGNGSNWVAESGATARTSLGLGSMATQNSDAISITGGSISGVSGLVSSITAGTGITGSATDGAITLNVGALTVSELAANSLQLSSESFADNDTSLMTSAAIQDKILSYGYTTEVGDITAVTAGTGMTGGGSSGAVTLTLDLKDEDNMVSNSATHAASQQSIKTYVDTEVAALVDSAPGALDTLNELAAAINDDATFVTTMNNALGNRVRVDASQSFTTAQKLQARTNIGATAPPTAGTGIDIDGTEIAVDVSDFMSNGVNNYLLTATGADTFQGESTLTYDGSVLKIDNGGDEVITIGGGGSGYQSIELGGDTGAYIDLKSPNSDDFDIRIITTGNGGEIQTASPLTFRTSNNNDDITFAPHGSGKVKIGSGGTEFTFPTARGTSGQVLKIGSGGEVAFGADDNDNHTYAISSATVTGGANLVLTAGGSGSGTDTVKLVGGTNTTITQSSDEITVTSLDTTYSTSVLDSTDDALIRLTAGGSGSGNDDIKLVAGANVTLTPDTGTSPPQITIAASTQGDITGITAGTGLSGGGSNGDVTLNVDVSEFSAVTPASGDSFLTLDSDGSTEQRTTVDALATLLAGTNISASSGVLSSTDTNTFRTVTAGGETLGASETLAFTAGSNVTITESNGAVTIASTDTNTNTQLSQEQVEDFVGGMLDGTETFISVSYDDTDGNIDFVVPVLDEDNMASNSATNLVTQQSIKAYVDSKTASIVDSAPAALDTLNELAAALNDDDDYFQTMNTALGNRLRIDDNQSLSGTQQAQGLTNLGFTATLAEINILDDGLSASDIPSLATSKITSGTFADARIAQSNVTQHLAVGSGGGIGLSGKTFTLDLDGMTDIGAALVDADLLIVDDGAGGTNRKATMSRLKTYMQNGLTFTTNTNTNQLTTFTLTADSGSNQTIEHGNTLDIAGSSPIVTSVGGTDTVTVSLDDPANLSQLTESTDATDDKILLWDESASAWKYMTIDDLQDSIDTSSGGGAVSAVANGADNRIVTFSSADALNGEANLVFDGTSFGIGESSPLFPLHLKYTDNRTDPEGSGSSSGAGAVGVNAQGGGLFIENLSTTDGSWAGVTFRTDTADARIAYQSVGSSLTNEGQMSFFLDTNDSPNQLTLEEVFRLRGGASGGNQTFNSAYVNGRLGVGTASPASLLHVGSTAYELSSGAYLTGSHQRTAKMVIHADDANTDWDEQEIGLALHNEDPTNNNWSPHIAFTTHEDDDGNPANANPVAVAAISATYNTRVANGWAKGDLVFFTNNAGSGNAERLRITGAGNVGIGTTSPATKLHIERSESDAENLMLRLRDSTVNAVGERIGIEGYWNTVPAGDIEFELTNTSSGASAIVFSPHSTGGTKTEAMRIASDGNVGIGTTSPGTSLHVTDAAEVTLSVDSSHATGSQISLDATGTGGHEWRLVSAANGATGITDDTGAFGLYSINGSSNGYKLVVEGTTGRVGIGNTSPAITLDVKSGSQYTNTYKAHLSLIDNQTAYDGSNPGGAVIFGGIDDSSSGTSWWSKIAGEKANATDGNRSGILNFYTRKEGGNPTSRMVINEDGEVGIGTASPSVPLHVAASASDASTGVLISNTATSGNSSITALELKNEVGTDSSTHIEQDAYGATRFYTGQGSKNLFMTVAADGQTTTIPGSIAGTATNATLAATVTVSNSTANTNFPVVFHDESNALLDDTGALRYNPSTGTLLVPNLSVAGTTTQVNTVTMEAQNAIVFEGATADAHETTLTITDPTADRTITLPNNTGTVALTIDNVAGLNAVNDRDLAPEDLSYANDFNVFFTSKEGLEDGSTSGGNYMDAIVLNTWSDASGHDANVLAFDKSTKAIYHYQADQAATNWGTASQLAYLDSTMTGNAAFTGTLTVGVDDTGHDVKFFGATAGAYMLYDQSEDQLIVHGPNDALLKLNDGNDSGSHMTIAGGRAKVGYSGNNLFLQGSSSKGVAFGVNNGTFGSGEVARFDTSGNFGIGTTSPVSPLHVSGGDLNIYNGTSESHLVLRRDATGTNYGSSVRFEFGDSGGTHGGVAASASSGHLYGRLVGAIQDSTNGSEDGYLRFDTSENGTITEQMRINGTGQLLVGKTTSVASVDRNLEVEGTIAAASGGSGGVGFHMKNSEGEFLLYTDGGNMVVKDYAGSDTYPFQIQGTAENDTLVVNTGGDVTVKDALTIGSEIIHAGDTNNKIGFGTDTQTFTTAGSARMTIEADGDIAMTEDLDVAKHFSFDTQHVGGSTGGGTGTENGANTWCKVLSWDPGTSTFRDLSLTLGITAVDVGSQNQAIINVYGRSNATNGAHTMGIKVISLISPVHLQDDSFKLITEGWGQPIELWMKKFGSYGTYNWNEVAKKVAANSTLTYYSNSAWQSTEPVKTNGTPAAATSYGTVIETRNPVLNLYHNQNVSGLSAGDVLSTISFRKHTTHGGNETIRLYNVQGDSGSSGASDDYHTSDFRISTRTAGTNSYTDRFTILGQEGYVGIGTTSPGHKLHVTSPPDDSGDYAIYADEGSDNYAALVNRHSGNRRTALFYRNIHADYTAQPMVEMHNDHASDDQTVLEITQDGSGPALTATGGNVGIGTTSPGALLHVSGDLDGGDFLLLESDESNANNDAPDLVLFRNKGSPGADTQLGSIKFRGRNNNSQDVEYAEIQSEVESGIDGSENGRLKFSTMDDGTLTTVMTIDGQSKVGIGTTSPQAPLHVVGNVMIANTDSDNTVKDSRILGRTYTNNDYNLIYGYADATTNRLYLGGGTGTGEPATDIRFFTAALNADTDASGTEAMRILSNGYVGIGTTSATFPLDVNGWIATASGIVHTGDTNNTIQFETDIQKFNTAGTTRLTIAANGNVTVAGAFSAATKSFDIEHPTKEDKRLHHGSLEGPEHGVYVRGRLEGDVIELPDYWLGLVDADTITVQLTPNNGFQQIYVDHIEGNKVYVGTQTDSPIDCFYFIQAERVDVEKMVVEY